MGIRCPGCKNRLVQKAGDRVRLRIEGIPERKDEQWYAKCYWCKKTVPIPITLTINIDQIPGERFGIRRPNRSNQR